MRNQILNSIDVALRPEAVFAAGCEALDEGIGVQGFALAVDPAVAEGGVDGFGVGDGGDLRDDGFLADFEPEAGGGARPVGGEPGVEGGGGGEVEGLEGRGG